MTSVIRGRAERLATFRSISLRLMEMLARWVPTTAEMEPKVLFGRHIWDFAQHADLLGKRTFELRAPLQYTLAPAEDYQHLLAKLSAAKATTLRMALLYGALLPGLRGRYEGYLETADRILDEPSIRIVERITADLERMHGECRELTGECPQFRHADLGLVRDFARQEGRVSQLVAPHAPGRSEAGGAGGVR
jgi:hypothetical protein